MSTFPIKNPRTGAELASNARLANTFMSRFFGLMGKPSLPAGEGLLIVPCNSVHCFGMKFAIDVVFLDKANTIIRIIPDMGRGRVSPIVRGAHAVLELPAGTVAATGTQVGDRLDIGATF